LLFYGAATLLTFPVLETLLFGSRAPQYGHDVFDDGAVTRLGAIRLDWWAYGPSLWNPHLAGGNAHFGQFMATPLALDALLALVISPFAAYAIRHFLTLLSAALAMHVFLSRSVRLGVTASVAGSLVYLFGFWHYNFGFSVALLPLMLCLSDEVEANPARRHRIAALTALLAGFLFYNVSSQATVLVSGLHLVYAVTCAEGWAKRLSRLRLWGVTWALGLGLYAPVLLTQLRLLPDSVRSIRNDIVWSSGPAGELLDLVQRYAQIPLSVPVLTSLGRPQEPTPYGTLYVGLFGLVLLCLSVGQPRSTRREQALAWLLLGIPLLDLLTRTALLRLQGNWGLLRSFQLVRVRLFMPFALAANVAIAVACLQRMNPNRPARWISGKRRQVVIGSGILLAFVSSLLCARVIGYLVRRHGWPASAPARETMAGWVAGTAYFAVGALGLAVWAFCARTRGGANAQELSRWRSLRMGFPSLLIGVLIADRVIYCRIERYIDSGHLSSFREALDETPAIQFLKRKIDADHHRVLMFADRSRWSGRDHPNKLMYWGLYTADGYQNIYPLRYHDVFGLLTAPYLRRDPVRRRYYESWGERAYAFGPEIEPSIASLMGIRWFYAAGAPVKAGDVREVFHDGNEVIYENPEVFPRAFVVGRARVFPGRGPLLAALERATLRELRTTAFLERGQVETLLSSLETPDVGSIRWISDAPDRVALETNSSGPTVLVLTDNYVPGWLASVNGVAVPIFPVYDCFRGVYVGGGRRKVVFQYAPRETYLGFAMASLSALILAVMAVRGRSRFAAAGSAHGLA
jgi:hypothetical protein